MSSFGCSSGQKVRWAGWYLTLKPGRPEAGEEGEEVCSPAWTLFFTSPGPRLRSLLLTPHQQVNNAASSSHPPGKQADTQMTGFLERCCNDPCKRYKWELVTTIEPRNPEQGQHICYLVRRSSTPDSCAAEQASEVFHLACVLFFFSPGIAHICQNSNPVRSAVHILDSS